MRHQGRQAQSQYHHVHNSDLTPHDLFILPAPATASPPAASLFNVILAPAPVFFMLFLLLLILTAPAAPRVGAVAAPAHGNCLYFLIAAVARV